jgi:hypothetical protein
MKNLPEKIYLTAGPVDPDVDFKDLSEVSWCTERIEKTDPEYFLMPDIKAEAEKLFLDIAWPVMNSTILVNFLRMPEEHKIHLLASIKERRPDLFESKPEETK